MRKPYLFLLTLVLTLLLSGCGGKETDPKMPVPSMDTPNQTQTVPPSDSEDAFPTQPIDPSISSKTEETETPETSLTGENPPPSTPTESTDTPTMSEPESDPSISSISEECPEIDIDLTGFSSNMLYAEVYNMGMNPNDYVGKVISLTGDFASFPKDLDNNGNPISDEEIFVCLVSDAMACCQSGIEFIPEKNSLFWKERPTEGSKITITGMCDIFLDEGGWFTIIQLDNAKIEWQS